MKHCYWPNRGTPITDARLIGARQLTSVWHAGDPVHVSYADRLVERSPEQPYYPVVLEVNPPSASVTRAASITVPPGYRVPTHDFTIPLVILLRSSISCWSNGPSDLRRNFPPKPSPLGSTPAPFLPPQPPSPRHHSARPVPPAGKTGSEGDRQLLIHPRCFHKSALFRIRSSSARARPPSPANSVSRSPDPFGRGQHSMALPPVPRRTTPP